jgi:hypothetical protein
MTRATHTQHTMPLSATALETLAEVARDAIVADIQTECARAAAPGETTCDWYDTRPMLDPREHAPQVLDMAARALALADAMRIITRHPGAPHLVRITKAA